MSIRESINPRLVVVAKPFEDAYTHLDRDLHTQINDLLNQFLLYLILYEINNANLYTNLSLLLCVILTLSSQSHLDESDVALTSMCKSGSRSKL